MYWCTLGEEMFTFEKRVFSSVDGVGAERMIKRVNGEKSQKIENCSQFPRYLWIECVGRKMSNRNFNFLFISPTLPI